MGNLVKLKLSNNIIEKIQNLEMLVHLKELDLSFNRIAVMENLNDLRKLEVLLLYENKISVVKEIDDLAELTIFSIGRNKIADWEHVIYLRQFPKLRSLNTAENPCAEKDGYFHYLFAFIPQLIYHQYKMITNYERRTAMEKYYRELSNLEEMEAKKKKEADIKLKQEKQFIIFNAAYVAYLNDGQLFEQMFANDKEGNNLRMVTDDTQNAYEEYRKKFCDICQELFELGLKEHERRTHEIKLFKNAVDEGMEDIQNRGRRIVDDVLNKKKEIFINMKQLLQKITTEIDSALFEKLIHNAREYSDEFDELLSNAWTQLMTNETTLHDQMEDINEVFRINMRDIVDSFLEAGQGFFSQMRNSEAEYTDTINGIILYYLSSFGDEAKIPSHLLDVCGDKDILSNNIAASHDLHLEIIDSHEDRMMNRLKKWLEEYAEKLFTGESERNRQRILEISHFVESQKRELNSKQLLQQLNLDLTDPDIILMLDT